MIVIPAIDLQGGRCVRLRQGRAEEAVVYSEDPLAVARRWVEEGARFLHVVDLDGAFQGRPVHADVIARIVEAAGVNVQVGGGLRTTADIEDMLSRGAARVVVGTRACEDAELLREWVARFGERLAVGVDARDGQLQIRGWTQTLPRLAVDWARDLEQMGVSCIVYTDTARDGMLEGVNVRGVAAICEAVRCSVIASGGVSSVGDVRRLRELGYPHLVGVIVGKALYDGRVSLRALQEAANPER